MALDSGDDGASELVTELRRLKPAKLRAVLSDGGEPRDIALSQGRNRWAQAAKTLATFAWARLEALDAKGAILGVIQADGALQPEQTGQAPKEYAFLQLLISGQKMALSENRDTIDKLMGQFANLAGALTDRVAMLEKNYSAMLNMATRAQLALASASDEEGGDGVMLEILKLLNGGGPKKKLANGTPKTEG